MRLPLHLFVPFYTPPDLARANELLRCLRKNLDSGIFEKVVLLVDDATQVDAHPRLVVVKLDRRPTYADWIRHSFDICPGSISVLANSDIFFDISALQIGNVVGSGDRVFVALTRFDLREGEAVPHPNPHWSQDTWAVRIGAEISPELTARLEIPMGVPRCDNKVAYAFSIAGFTVFNPFPFVRSYHLHETEVRYYQKRGDRRILGGVAMVHPGRDLLSPAELDIEVWSAKTTNYKSIKLNRTLEKWDAEQAASIDGAADSTAKTQSPTSRRNPRTAGALPHARRHVISHDADWQYPAITEQHAFAQMRSLMPKSRDHGVAYLGFPFATLIDLHAHMGANHPRTLALQEKLDALSKTLQSYERVVTVSQHIRSHLYPQIFEAAGVTDLFWSHTMIGQTQLPETPAVRTYAFPLFPVQQTPRSLDDVNRQRQYLYSFVGARALKNYLTPARTWIIDHLGDDPRGRVIARDSWHYQKVVYDAQVLAKKAASGASELVSENDSTAFRDVMDDSVFALCPSGSGPNSIRLWEAALNGSIPVIISDNWQRPGEAGLWDLGSVNCAETEDAVRELPDRLAALAAQPDRIASARRALDSIVRRYGPANFVHDVLRLINTIHVAGNPSGN